MTESERRIVLPHDRPRARLGGLLTCLALCCVMLTCVPGGAMAQEAESEEAARQRNALRLGDTDSRRAAAAWLGRHGSAEALPALMDALRDSDHAVRVISESAMWSIWLRSGDEAIDHQVQMGAELMQEQRYDEALKMFEEVVREAPDFAEGYNKRATALYYLGEYQRSLADIRETLARNQFHFGALSGAGLCWMALREPAQALYYFERALAINPNLAGIRGMVEQLRRLAEGQMM